MVHDPTRSQIDGPELLADALDRLADGALNADERRELFCQLDNSPDGWRACALALLEVRAWEQALRSPLLHELPQRERGPQAPEKRDGLASPSPAKLSPRLPMGSGAGSAKLRWCALAASVVAAFGIGWWGRSFDAAGPGPLWPGGQVVQQPLEDATGPDQTLVSASHPQAPQAALPGQQRVYRVVFSDPLSGREWEQSVVAEERENLDYAGLAPGQSVVPPWLQAELEQQGQQVQQRRRVFAYPLEDGRQLIVPVDEVQITPVALPAY